MQYSEDEIIKYKKGARNLAIGLGVATVGMMFDYHAVDDIMAMGGGCMVGWHLFDTINYFRYVKQKRAEQKE